MDERRGGGAEAERWPWWAAASAAQAGLGVAWFRRGKGCAAVAMPFKAFAIASLFVGAGATGVAAGVLAAGVGSVEDMKGVGASIRRWMGAPPRRVGGDSKGHKFVTGCPEFRAHAARQQQNGCKHTTCPAASRLDTEHPWAAGIGGRGVGGAVTLPRSCPRSTAACAASGIKPARRIATGRSPSRHVRHSLPPPAPGPHKEHGDGTARLRNSSLGREERRDRAPALRQWLEHLAVAGGGAEGGTQRAAGRRCGRVPGWRRRTRCCWSTCARTGPATGAPFDPKASCRAPASPAASAGSTSSGPTSRLAASSLPRRSGWCWSCRRSSGTSGRGSPPTCRGGRTTTSRTSGAPGRSGSPGSCAHRSPSRPAGAPEPRHLRPHLWSGRALPPWVPAWIEFHHSGAAPPASTHAAQQHRSWTPRMLHWSRTIRRRALGFSASTERCCRSRRPPTATCPPRQTQPRCYQGCRSMSLRTLCLTTQGCQRVGTWLPVGLSAPAPWTISPTRSCFR